RNIFSSRLHSGAAALVRTVIGAKRIARKLPRNKRASIPANLRNASTILNWQPLMAGISERGLAGHIHFSDHAHIQPLHEFSERPRASARELPGMQQY